MEIFSLEQGMLTSTCPTIWALRMRVNMSAIGSLMLIADSLPARLDHAGDLAAHRQLAQLDAAEAEFLVDAARAPGERTAVAQPHRRRVARQPLQLGARRIAVLVRRLDVVDHLEQRGAPCLELLDCGAALLFAELDCELGHGGQPFGSCTLVSAGACSGRVADCLTWSMRNGKRNAVS